METMINPLTPVLLLLDAPVPLKRKPIMGSVEIEIERDGKTITAHVDVDYFRRPTPSTYWINGDPGDDGEVVLGDAMDDWGRSLTLSDDEQERAIEAFKDK